MIEILPDASPADLGLSLDGLAALDAGLSALIADGELAGASLLVARRGKVVHRALLGMKDIARGEAPARDTIYRVYSMTKPVTAVAMMILWDRGLWSPDDPIARHLPEFQGVRLADGKEPSHPPTMGELMTHTAGLGYGYEPNDPIDIAYIAEGVWEADDLADMMRRIVRAPLAYDPGSAWRYSIAMDVQGAVIERITGRSLPDFMREEIFAPLGMVDTDFFVPAEKRARLATLYRHSKTRGLVETSIIVFGVSPERIPGAPSGGAGLFSTIDDYARFAQMLLERGSLGGVRILSPEAVELMTANHLSDEILAGGHGVGHQPIRPGFGYGFNGGVFTDPVLAGSGVGRGTYQWDGAAGTWFWVDPENELVFVGMIQRLDYRSPPCQRLTQAWVADALD